MQPYRTLKGCLIVFVLLATIAFSDAPAHADETNPFGGGDSTEQLGESELTIERTEDIGGGPPGLDFREASYTYTPPCAEWGFGPGASGDAATEEDEDAPATDEELLAASTYVGPQSKSEPIPGQAKRPEPRPDSPGDKVAKSPARRGGGGFYYQDPVDVDAVNDLWDSIREAEEEILNTIATEGEYQCQLYYSCGGERVDDVLFGRISDAPEGAYFDYVNVIGGLIESTLGIVFPLSAVTLDRDALASGIADSGFGDQPQANVMPVFYFCRRGEGGPIELTDPLFQPSFEWATTIEDQYDVPGARVTSLETIRTLLNGNLPEMQTIPPVERGFTFVQLPMWLWLENIDDLSGFVVHALSEEQTVRLSTRATLVDVTWNLGDGPVTCTASDMKPFIHGESQITDPTPACSYKFTELRDYQMTATARYYLEEQVSYRGSTSYAWPAGAWVQHPTTPFESISNQTGVMEVHNIASVNVPITMNDLVGESDGG